MDFERDMAPKAFQIIGQESSCSSPGKDFEASDRKRGSFHGRAAIVTLGCSKNQVDSEVMLGVLASHGFEIVNHAEEADVVVVNTCGFLESAVQEGIDCVLDLAELKEVGRLRKLIVSGCAVSRYRADLEAALPEVDAFLSLDDLLRVGEVAAGGVGSVLEEGGRPYFLYDDSMPRILSTESHSAYVKIAEGCDRPCTFCIIPRIRGNMRSRRPESVTAEVKQLVQSGVREVNLVAQDLTSYGRDQRSSDGLIELLRSISAVRDLTWIRLLYAYPIGTSEELLKTIVELPNVCNYLDIPLQHASVEVLKGMQRPIGRFAPRPITELIRTVTPEIAIRTTFIVGFPGETEKDIRELEAFVSEGHFTNVGVFEYSPEEGTPAFELPGQVPASERAERRERIMAAQQEVVRKRLEGQIGTTIPVMIDGLHPESDLLLAGRSEFQAPEVDGMIVLNDVEPGVDVSPGALVAVHVEEVLGYDLVGRVVSEFGRVTSGEKVANG